MALFARNFDKVGPGVPKNRPEKKDAWLFLELFGRYFKKLFYANLWTILLTIPVVTVGLAQCGMTYVARTVAKERQVFVTSDFFETIKKNWKQTLAIGIIDTIVTAIIGWAIWFYMHVRDMKGGWPALVVAILFALVFAMSGFYRYTLAITFDFKLSKIYKNSFLLIVLGFKRNCSTLFSLIVLYALLGAITYLFGIPGLLISVLCAILVVPEIRALLIQVKCFPVIMKYIIEPYYAEHPDEDKQKLIDLGILPYETDEDVDWGE